MPAPTSYFKNMVKTVRKFNAGELGEGAVSPSGNRFRPVKQLAKGLGTLSSYKLYDKSIPVFPTKNNIDNNYRMATKSKFRTKRRNYRRKRISYRRRGRKVATLWPQQRLVKFKVCQSYAPTAAGSTNTDVLILKANDLNDPTGAAGASLPLGLDQWASMYSKYCVLGSKCTVQYHGETTNTGSTLIGINLLRDSSGLTQLEHYKEMPYGVDHLISPDNDRGRLSASYSLKRFDKIFKTKTAEDYHGTFTTTPGSPNEIRYWHLWYQDADKTQTCAMEFIITIEYIVLLFESITPSRSSL